VDRGRDAVLHHSGRVVCHHLGARASSRTPPTSRRTPRSR
jgi:hypothetical protein